MMVGEGADRRFAAIKELLHVAISAAAASGAGPKVVAAITSAAMRTAIFEAGTVKEGGVYGPEVSDRLNCIAPLLQADLDDRQVTHEAKLRRNVAAHAPLLPGGPPVSDMSPVALRRAQRGARAGRHKGHAFKGEQDDFGGNKMDHDTAAYKDVKHMCTDAKKSDCPQVHQQSRYDVIAYKVEQDGKEACGTVHQQSSEDETARENKQSDELAKPNVELQAEEHVNSQELIANMVHEEFRERFMDLPSNPKLRSPGLPC